MEKTLNRQQAQAILDTRPDGVDIPTALKELSNQGFIIEGYNDNKFKNVVSNVSSGIKSAVGGFGEGVTGIALSGLQKGAELAVDKFGTEQMKQNLAKAPTLREQYRGMMGAEQNPNLYGAGEFTGQIASLAAPVSAIGNVAKTGAQSVGLGKGAQTITKAAAEGLAFTGGQSLQEGEVKSTSDYLVNTALNVAFPVAGIVAKETAPRIVNSLIKPLAKDFAYEKNPGKAVAELGITGNSWEELINNITSAKDRVGQSIGQVINKSQNLGQIDLSQTLKSIDEAINNAYKTPRTNASLIGRLEGVKQDLVDNIQNGIDPQSYKGLVGELTKWTGNASDDQAVNKALKRVYGSTRSAMDDILSKELTPAEFSAYKKASEQYGNLLSAENAARYRDKIVERQDLISFGSKNAGLITGLATAVATGGSAVPAIIAGLSASALDKAMATPAFKTRLAAILAKMAPEDVGTLFDKVPATKTLFTPEQIKDFTGELKKNTKLNRGMIDLDAEVLPKKKVVSSLEQEAKKYKSAEEFVKAQGVQAFHGTPEKFDNFDISKAGKSTDSGMFGKGFYFTNDIKEAKTYSTRNGKTGEVKDVILNLKNPLVLNSKNDIPKINVPMDTIEQMRNADRNYSEAFTKYLKDNGYDGVVDKISGNKIQYVVLDNTQIKTKKELLDIWDKNKK